MASTPGPFCSQCGAPLQGSQRFCTNCGATIEVNANSPTISGSQTPATPSAGAITPGSTGFPAATYPNVETAPAARSPQALPGGSIYTNNDNQSLLPPPPPPPTYNPYMQGQSSNYSQTTMPDPPPSTLTPSPQAGAYQVPAYAQKPKGNRGCVTGSVVLLLVLALGVGGYFLLHALGNRGATGNGPGSNGTPGNGTPYNGTATSATNNSTPGSTTGANAATTEQLNLQVTYASIGITMISAQIASSFADDTSTTAGSAGVVRINLRENNATASNPDYIEADSMLLLLPGGTTAQPSNEQQGVSPAQGVNRLNWLDFPLNAQVALNQLTLRIGKQGENQMDIPLQARANLSKYQDKTSNLNTPFKYGSLSMTIKTATLSYSYADQQASTGNSYVILTLAATNNTSTTIDVYPPSYMRMQASGNSIQPDNTYTLPYGVNANTSASGVVAFLVPQNTTTFTLVMLAQPDATPAISQVTQGFQIQ